MDYATKVGSDLVEMLAQRNKAVLSLSAVDETGVLLWMRLLRS